MFSKKPFFNREKDMNITNKIKIFWENQSSSRHRYDTKKFYMEKAKEHKLIIDNNINYDKRIVDICCGFGEMLKEYLDLGLRIETALDYSNNAIKSAIGNPIMTTKMIVCAIH